MREIWLQIEDWLGKHAPAVQASFLPGASPGEIEALSAALGRELPAELRELLSILNGQDRSKRLGLIGGWELLSCKGIVSAHRCFAELLEAGDFEGNEATNDDGKVKPVWWNNAWIPFAAGPAGDLLCFDMDPAEAGSPGQILTLWHAAR